VFTKTVRRSLRNRVVIDSFPSQSRFAASMGHESGGTSRPDFFLKPVAGSAARLAPPTLDGVSKLALEMAIYSLTGNARSPFHAEPAHSPNSLLLVHLDCTRA
jgi:hypothetical protein